MWKVPLGEDDYFSLLRLTLLLNGLHRCARADDAECALYWSISCPSLPVRSALRHPRCRILHFPHVQQITHKDLLTANISAQRSSSGQLLYPHMPAAFTLPDQLQQWMEAHSSMGGLVDERMQNALHSAHQQRPTREQLAHPQQRDTDEQVVGEGGGVLSSSRFHGCHSSEHQPSLVEAGSPIWIVKPAHLGSGRGIVVTDLLHHSAAVLPSLVDVIRAGCVAQRYIERPLLLGGNKFDIRLYALLLPSSTASMPPADTRGSERWSGFPYAVFVFNDGLIRLASQPYPTSTAAVVDSLRCPTVHLTNNSINAAGNGGAASNRSYLNFINAMREAGDESSVALADSIERQVGHCILTTLSSSSSYLRDGVAADFARHFDLLGFDVLLDASARLWLCEVNSMPDLLCASSPFSSVHPVDFECKRRLITDMCNLLDLQGERPGSTLPSGGFSRLV